MTQVSKMNWKLAFQELSETFEKHKVSAEAEFLRVEQELELKMADCSVLTNSLAVLQEEFRKMRQKAYSEERRANREALNHNRALRIMDKLIGPHGTDDEPY